MENIIGCEVFDRVGIDNVLKCFTEDTCTRYTCYRDGTVIGRFSPVTFFKQRAHICCHLVLRESTRVQGELKEYLYDR